MTERKKRTSSADLGGTPNDILRLLPWTEQQQAENERKAALAAADYLGPGQDLQDVLEMLGLLDYRSAKKARNNTPLKHGSRATFVNRDCRCELCTEANNAYYREYRARQSAQAA